MVIVPEESMNKLNTNNVVGTVQRLGDVTSRLDYQLHSISKSNKNGMGNEYKKVLRRFLFFNHNFNN